MTMTIIEYTDGVETGRKDATDYGGAGLWARLRIESLNLVGPDDGDMETYSTPDGRPVRFVLLEEPRLNLLHESIVPERYKRSNGIIHGMVCNGPFYEFEGVVDRLACIQDRGYLTRQLRFVARWARELAEEIENLPQKVEND